MLAFGLFSWIPSSSALGASPPLLVSPCDESGPPQLSLFSTLESDGKSSTRQELTNGRKELNDLDNLHEASLQVSPRIAPYRRRTGNPEVPHSQHSVVQRMKKARDGKDKPLWERRKPRTR